MLDFIAARTDLCNLLTLTRFNPCLSEGTEVKVMVDDMVLD